MPNQYLPGVIAIPSSLLITNITQSSPMVVSVEVQNNSTEANTYIVGMAVRLFVPVTYKMFQANNLVGTITAIDTEDMEFTLNLDSSQFDEFVIPSGNVETPASLSPSGSRNLQYNNFTNKVPFQNLNNIGN
jgi:hypothetical protein